MKKILLHPLPLRIWHWANALMVILLVITGIQLRISGVASLRPHDISFLTHKYAGWAMAASWVIWLVYGLISDHLSRHYLFRKGDLKGTFRQAKFYLISIFRGEKDPFQPSPERKFNPMQKLAYGSIMAFFAPLLVFTGLFSSDTLFFRKYVLLWKIVGVLNAIHVMAAYVILLYLVFHVYMATLGPTIFAHTKTMILGYGEEPDDPERLSTLPQAAAARQELPKQ